MKRVYKSAQEPEALKNTALCIRRAHGSVFVTGVRAIGR